MLSARSCIFAGALLLSSGSAWSETGTESSSSSKNQLEFDFSIYQVEPSNITKSAVYALLNRDWDIQNIEKTSVTATHGAGSEKSAYSVAIKFDAFPKVQIAFTGGSDPNLKWLDYLKEDMLRALFSCVK